MTCNVSIDVRLIGSSGIGRYVSCLLKAISNRDDINLTFIGDKEKISPLLTNPDGQRIIHYTDSVFSMSEQLHILNLLPTECNLFFAPHFNIPIYPFKTIKRVVTIHDMFLLAYFHTLNTKQKLYSKVMLNTAASLSDRIITVSEFSKSEIVKYTKQPPSKIVTIRNGVDREMFKPCVDKSALKKLRERLNLPEKFILYVGNVKPHKNLMRLLKAFEMLLSEPDFKDLRLVIVGQTEGLRTSDKEFLRAVNENAKLSRHVLIKGVLSDDDLPYYYNLAAVTVHPSLYEGFGLPLVEAMASGSPVVCSNIPVMQEVCKGAARYVDPLKAESIAEGLREILTDDEFRVRMIKNGLKRAESFGWEQVSEQHVRVFKEIVNKKDAREY
ncbi:glycosyltransferase family 4 protein [Candidatus Magnetomonas plexicatena]|uniref:glycosyltransferase family 4 protein n=1 Tax=Candidatus Magnetomonas plexicatena TaxID=2552947 RepID=UPI001C76C0F9|nr:glycosyltransferase family 4 protein [Nitrospirales bacterium LBB_01]